MKHLKDTLSHDVRNCHEKLKREESQCAASRSQLAEMQSKSSNLLAELEDQREALKTYKHQTNTASARNVLQIASLAQTLENTKGDLIKARHAISVLDGINTECRKSSILTSYSKNLADKSSFQKNLYQHTVQDLEQAEKRIKDLDDSLKKELENVRESQVAESNAKINYLKERNSKHYFKNIAEKYSNMLEIMERKYIKTKSRQQQLGQEFEDLKTLASEMELNLEAFSNATVRAQNKAQNAMKSKQYVESMLINRISNDKEAYKSLKEMYQNQKNIISEMETQRSTLEESLVRKISSNRKKFLAAKIKLENTLAAVGANKRDTSSKYDTLKSKVGKSRGEKNEIKEELNENKVVIAEYQQQMELFQTYIEQIETNLLKLREDVIMREAIQREYVLSLSREHQADITSIHAHYKSLLSSNFSSANLTLKSYEELKKQHEEIARVLKEEESYGRYWKDAAKFQKHQAQVLSTELQSCKSGKVIAITECKETTESLLELVQGIASRPKVRSFIVIKYYTNVTRAYGPLPNYLIIQQIYYEGSESGREGERETL